MSEPKKADTWMPFYVTDYLGDTMHLTTLQHGAYVLLLLASWKSGGSLPDDDEQLAAITRMSVGEWRKSAGVLRRFFQAVDGVLVQGRLKKELDKAKALSEKRSAVGRLGGRPPKAKQTETNRFPQGQPKPKLHETPSPSHIPSSLRSEGLEPSALVPEAADAPRRPPPSPNEQIVELYHRHLPTLPRVEVLSDARKRTIGARWREVLADPEIARAPDPRLAALQFFDWYFDHAAKSRFLTGRAKDWRADFDFLMTPTKWVKVIEGHYHKEAA